MVAACLQHVVFCVESLTNRGLSLLCDLLVIKVIILQQRKHLPQFVRCTCKNSDRCVRVCMCACVRVCVCVCVILKARFLAVSSGVAVRVSIQSHSVASSVADA